MHFAIAAVLALPSPGALDHAGNFLVNLVPYLGEAKKAKKIKKLLELVDQTVGPIKKMKELKIPGTSEFVGRLLDEAGKLQGHIASLDLTEAKAAFGRLLGYVREAQVATKLQSKGATVEHLGKKVKQGRQLLTDIDVVTREGQRLVFTQVKSGSGAMLTPGSNRWGDFVRQAEVTKETAEALRIETGVMPQLRYVVDNITPEARTALQDMGFAVETSASFLK